MASDLAVLERQGVVRCEADRFAVCGGPDARLYLKYALKHHTGLEVAFLRSYARRATNLCGEQMRRALLGPEADEGPVVGHGRRLEMGNAQAGLWMREICDAVGDRNLVALSGPSRRVVLPASSLDDAREHGLVLFGLALRVGVQEVDYLEMGVNYDRLPESTLRERAQAFMVGAAPDLAQYDVTVLDYRCEVLDPDLALATLAYSQLCLYNGLVVVFYNAGLSDLAIELLTPVVDQVEGLVGDTPTDPLVRAELADALSRLGFMHMDEGQLDLALKYLMRSTAISASVSWLVEFNASVVMARIGELAEAASRGAVAAANVPADGVVVFLQAAFPVPESWIAPAGRWRAVRLKNWAPTFVDLHAKMLAARATVSAVDALREALDGVAAAAPVPVLRMAGWCELTIMGRQDRALDFFERALDLSQLDELDLADAEVAFAGSYDGD